MPKELSKIALEKESLKLEQLKLKAETTYLKRKIQSQDHLIYGAEQEKAEYLASNDQRHILPFFGAVNHQNVVIAMEKIAEWTRRDPGCDIAIPLNSPGGSVIDGLALYDLIEAAKDDGHSVKIIVRGTAASMGGILLQAGHERIVGKNAHILIHEVSTGMVGKFSEIEDEIAFTKKLQEQLLDILAERSTLNKTQIKRRWRKVDWWLGAEEAVKLGFADRIG